MSTYAQIPVSRLDYLLRELNKSTTPPSFLIKSLPGRGIVTRITEVYPEVDRITANTLEAGTMPEQMLRQALKQSKGQMIIIDIIDSPVTTISPELNAELRYHINDGGRVILVSAGDVFVDDALKSRMLLTAMVDG